MSIGMNFITAPIFSLDPPLIIGNSTFIMSIMPEFPENTFEKSDPELPENILEKSTDPELPIADENTFIMSLIWELDLELEELEPDGFIILENVYKRAQLSLSHDDMNVPQTSSSCHSAAL